MLLDILMVAPNAAAPTPDTGAATPLRSNLGHRPTLRDHRQHSLMTLLRHTELPQHEKGVKQHPEALSRINRNTVNHHPNTKGPESSEVIHCFCSEGGTRTRDTTIMSRVL